MYWLSKYIFRLKLNLLDLYNKNQYKIDRLNLFLDSVRETLNEMWANSYIDVKNKEK